jgi:hypothetical protein
MYAARAVLLAAVAVAGCQVAPNRVGTGSPKLNFFVYYQGSQYESVVDASGSGYVTDGFIANRCIYVASPFRVVTSAADPGGVGDLQIGAPYNNSLRVRPADTLVSPSPDFPTQHDDVFALDYPNPGSVPGSATVTVAYDSQGGRTYNFASLSVTYEFVPGQVPYAGINGTAHGTSVFLGRSFVDGYFVRLAGAGPNEQPGMSCPIPSL